MSINTQPINGFVVLNGSSTVITGSGTFAQFEQEIELLETGSGTFASFEQSLLGTGSGTFASIEQEVKTVAAVLAGCKNWDLDIRIAGTRVSNDTITGDISVTRKENNAALAEFTVRPGSGSFNATADQGKTVTIDAIQGADRTRIYTGIIDIPEVDVLREQVTYRCTDRRKEQINNQLTSAKSSIGYYSTTIFGEAEDTYAEVQDRLTTVPKALDFDAYGNYRITDLAAKSSADYTLGDSDIYSRTVNLEVTSRARIINKVDIQFEYRFPKLYHWETFFSWTHPGNSQFCLVLADGYTLTSKELVRQAVAAAGWPIRGDINFTDTPAAGWYRCSTSGSDPLVAWSPVTLTGTPTAATNPDGSTQVDAAGNTVYNMSNTTFTDMNQVFCLGASWTAAQRWAQTISESYSMTVQAPQSQTKFGSVTRTNRYGLESTFDTGPWEEYSRDDGAYAGSQVIDQDVNRQEMRNAVETALNVAKTTILASHRDNRVSFQRSLWPEIDLTDTVELDTTELDVIGKVSEIQHTFNASTAEATTALVLSFSQAEGSASDSTLSVPSAPTYTASQQVTGVQLGNHFGKDPSSAAAASWTGMVGNKFNCTNLNGYQNCDITQYPVYFIVDTPAVQSDARENRTVTTSASYNVEIPNDSLTISFDGKCRG